MLPIEIYCKIIDYSKLSSMKRCTLVNRLLRNVVYDNKLYIAAKRYYLTNIPNRTKRLFNYHDYMLILAYADIEYINYYENHNKPIQQIEYMSIAIGFNKPKIVEWFITKYKPDVRYIYYGISAANNKEQFYILKRKHSVKRYIKEMYFYGIFGYKKDMIKIIQNQAIKYGHWQIISNNIDYYFGLACTNGGIEIVKWLYNSFGATHLNNYYIISGYFLFDTLYNTEDVTRWLYRKTRQYITEENIYKLYNLLFDTRQFEKLTRLIKIVY